jgi:hypothetical protein
MSAFWFLISNLLAGCISFGAASLAFGIGSPMKLLLATIAGFSVVSVAAVLLTGIFGVMTVQWVVLCLSFVALCGVLIPGIRRSIVAHMHLTGVGRSQDPAPTDPMLRGVAIVLSMAFVAVPLARCFVLGTNFGSDDLSYHGPSIAEWIIQKAVVYAPFDYHAYYPFNAEALAAWFILPFHTDGFIGLTGAYWLILLWLSAFSLVVAMGGSRLHGVIAGAVIFAAPVVDSVGARVSSPDLAGVAMVLAAISLLTPDRRRMPTISPGAAIFAGLLLGFALGCKVSYGLALAIVVGWIVFSSHIAPRLITRLRVATIVAACSIVTGGAWYIRNWILTGDPVFPAQIGPFAGPFTHADQARTELITWILQRPTDPAQWSVTLRGIMDWPPSLFAFSALGYAGCLWALIRRRGEGNPFPIQTLLLLLGLFMSVMFFFLPFSATYNEPHGVIDPAIRYAILPFAIGIMCFGSFSEGSPRRRLLYFSLSLLAVIPAWTAGPVIGLLLVAFALLVPYINRFIDYFFGMEYSRRARWLSGGGLVVLLCLVALQPVAQHLTDQRVYDYGLPDKPLGPAWKAMESVPPGARIAWFGNKLHEYYPLYGRQFNRVPVALDPSGVPFERLHHLFLEHNRQIAWWSDEPPVDSSKFRENIRRSGIDYVLVSKFGGDDWPPQQRILEHAGDCTPVYQDGFATIWRISPEQAAGH